MNNYITHLLLILLISFFFLPGLSHAGIYNYQEVLVGEKAAGMGGAFTALADDATATFYNPAGIVQIPFNSVSASANAITVKTRTGKFFLQDNEKLTSFDFIPTFWGVTASTALGKVGFSIIVPESDNFELHENYSNVNAIGYTWNTARSDITFESDSYLIGPTYTFYLTPRLSAGVSAFFLYNTFTENLYEFWDTTDAFLENSLGSNRSGTGITGKVGLLYKMNDKFRVSMVLRPPSEIEIEAKVRQVAYVKEVGDPKVHRGNVEGTTSYSRRLPYSSTVGLAWLPSDRFTLAFDLSYYGPADYTQKTIDLINFNPETRSKNIILKNVINGNLGMEYMLTTTIPVRAGIFTDFSSAPEVRDIDAAQPAHLDKYGVTLSSGNMTANSTTIVGIKYSFGQGYGTAKDYDTIPVEFRKEAYTQTDIVLFISGTYMF